LIRAELAKGFVHVTGGGFYENIPRILPDGIGAEVDCTGWTPQPVFQWLAKTGKISPPEMARTFNCGIGFVAVVAADQVEEAQALLQDIGEESVIIGRTTDTSGVTMEGLEGLFA
jgi:phosphoribosylformylglycinamidine cyclo-ligase